MFKSSLENLENIPINFTNKIDEFIVGFELDYLSAIDQEIQKEHKSYLQSLQKKYPLTSYVFINNDTFDYGLLNCPDYWSSSRFLATSIKAKDERKSYFISVQERIEFLKLIKSHNTKVLKELKELEELEKDYQEFFNHLKERFLAKAIQETYTTLEQNPIVPIDRSLKQIFNDGSLSPINLQTKEQCVEKHARVTKVIAIQQQKIKSTLKKTEDISKHEKYVKDLRQLEILTQLKIDIHYENAEKKTKSEFVLDTITAVTSLLGFISGVISAGCWVLSLVSVLIPPLIPLIPLFSAIATVTGYMSFVSYAGMGINIFNICKNGINGRSPSVSEIKDLVIDSIFLPLDIIGGSLLKKMGHLFKSHKIAHTFNLFGKLYNNFFSNIEEGPWMGDTTTNLKESYETVTKAAGSSYEMIHGTSTTTLSKIESDLLSEHGVTKTTECVSELEESTLSKTGCFFLKKSTTENRVTLTTSQSRHDFIVNWSVGFFNSIKYSTELHYIQKAQKEYIQLSPNATYRERYMALMEIRMETTNYIAVNSLADDQTILTQIEKLHKCIKTETDALIQFIEGKELPPQVPNDTLDFRPVMLGIT